MWSVAYRYITVTHRCVPLRTVACRPPRLPAAIRSARRACHLAHAHVGSLRLVAAVVVGRLRALALRDRATGDHEQGCGQGLAAGHLHDPHPEWHCLRPGPSHASNHHREHATTCRYLPCIIAATDRHLVDVPLRTVTPLQVYKGEVRVRAFNCGTAKPGPWSEVIQLKTEKEEGLGDKGIKQEAHHLALLW